MRNLNLIFAALNVGIAVSLNDVPTVGFNWAIAVLCFGAAIMPIE